MTVEQPVDRPEWESPEPAGWGGWLHAAGRGFIDLRFRQTATQTLLPLVYVVGLGWAITVPVVLTVLLWQWSMLAGLIFAVLGAVPVAVMIAAIVRLLLEFLVHTAQLAARVGHITALAEGLHGALTEVTVPMTQLSKDLRAVQFWRLGRR